MISKRKISLLGAGFILAGLFLVAATLPYSTPPAVSRTYNPAPETEEMSLKELEELLEKCVSEEDYEQAILIRDKIKSIKKDVS